MQIIFYVAEDEVVGEDIEKLKTVTFNFVLTTKVRFPLVFAFELPIIPPPADSGKCVT